MNDKTDKPALEVVPAPALSLAQVLELAKKDCRDWLALIRDETGADPKIFRAFADCLDSLSAAKNKEEEVCASIKPFAELCLDMMTQVGTVNSEECVRGEVKRRQDWLSVIDGVQGEIEMDLEEIAGELAHNKKFKGSESERVVLQGKVDNLERYIKSLIELRTAVRDDLSALEVYLRAVERVAKGCPQELFGKVLPEIPLFVEEPEEKARIEVRVTESGAEILDTEAATSELSERRKRLREIAERHGFLEVEVFVYSLYDLFGAENELLGKLHTHRSSNRVVDTGLGIAPGFGWRESKDFFAGSGWRKELVAERGFLRQRGSVGIASLWTRTGKPLPWNSKSLFTEVEIMNFVEKMRQSVLPPDGK